MTIDTAYIKPTTYHPVHESPVLPPAESLCGSVVRHAPRALRADPLTLFVRAGETCGSARADCAGSAESVAAGGAPDCLLHRGVGRAPVERLRQNVRVPAEPGYSEERGTGKDRAGRRDWEMDVARMMQNRLFPGARPRIAGLDYYSDWRPAQGLSGDYLDYFEMAEGNLGLVIGEVAAKGWPAALLTSNLHSMARALRHSGRGGLSDWVAAMDEMFYEIAPDHTYATLFVAQYDPASGLLHYVNAGHEAPLVLRRTGQGYRILLLESANPVIGMRRQSPFRESALSLDPGDLLVASTDGLCGTTNPRGEEWGFRRLLETVRASSYRKARDIVDCVLGTAEAFAAGCPRHDDMTLWLGRVEQANHGERPRQAGCEIAMAA